jgi:adenylate kinase
MEEPMNVVLIGPPGSGKGTQARRLAAHYGLEHVQVGAMLRAHARELSVAPALAEGALVPDDVVIGLVRDRLLRNGTRRGVVLDGFPRNLAQAQALDRELEELELQLSVILHFRLSDELCIDRLLGRARREGRPDDVLEVAVRRLELYHRETEPLVPYYERTGRRVVPIHAALSLDGVWREIRDAVELVPAT